MEMNNLVAKEGKKEKGKKEGEKLKEWAKIGRHGKNGGRRGISKRKR